VRYAQRIEFELLICYFKKQMRADASFQCRKMHRSCGIFRKESVQRLEALQGVHPHWRPYGWCPETSGWCNFYLRLHASIAFTRPSGWLVTLLQARRKDLKKRRTGRALPRSDCLDIFRPRDITGDAKRARRKDREFGKSTTQCRVVQGDNSRTTLSTSRTSCWLPGKGDESGNRPVTVWNMQRRLQIERFRSLPRFFGCAASCDLCVDRIEPLQCMQIDLPWRKVPSGVYVRTWPRMVLNLPEQDQSNTPRGMENIAERRRCRCRLTIIAAASVDTNSNESSP